MHDYRHDRVMLVDLRRRIDGEDWKETMNRMNDRLEQGQRLYCCEPWSMVFARSQWRYIKLLMDAYPLLWTRTICKFNVYTPDDPDCVCLPRRAPGHSRMRWDDRPHPIVLLQNLSRISRKTLIRYSMSSRYS